MLFSSSLLTRKRLPENSGMLLSWTRYIGMQVKEMDLPPQSSPPSVLSHPCALGVFCLSGADESQCTHTYTVSSALNTRLLFVYSELDDDVFRESKKKFSPSHSVHRKIPTGSAASIRSISKLSMLKDRLRKILMLISTARYRNI